MCALLPHGLAEYTRARPLAAAAELAPKPDLARRWRALARGTRAALLGLAVLLAGALALRAWLTLAYGPAFLGFGDSHEYVTAAALGVFRDAQKPAGYPIFLAILHALGARLMLTILVQHVLGIATGLALFGAVRRTGAPAWLGLAPAAVVFFGGTGVLLEHALLADSLFAFLQALGVYAAVRALSRPRAALGARGGSRDGRCRSGSRRWASRACCSCPACCSRRRPGTRGAGCSRRRRRRARRRRSSSATRACRRWSTGYWGYERQGAWNLYGRVATFVECSRFTPPAGTRSLCPAGAPSARGSESFYQYARASPAVARFGGPARANAHANSLLERFSVTAITHEPIAYAEAIVRSLGFYFSPRAGEGYTPASIREALLEAKGTRSIQPAIAAYYPHDHGYRAPAGDTGATRALDAYERHTRIEGPLLVAMLLAALIGAPLLRGRVRAAALLFTLTAILSVALAAAGNSYDARYGYPAFGPLAAGAALGAWGIALRLTSAGRSPT